jgi:D-sedoheptulose 7-phosphate isomerase
MDNVNVYLDHLRMALDSLPGPRLTKFGEMLYRAYRNEKQVFTLGNGGSASTASHMAADLAKNTIGPNMRRFRVLSLNDNVPMLTALANDLGYESVFSEQLKSLIRAGDLLIVLSTSGSSPNVINAVRCAREQSAEVVAIVGSGGGEAAEIADLSIVVPSDHSGVIEDIHLVINHIVIDYFKSKLADEDPWFVA